MLSPTLSSVEPTAGSSPAFESGSDTSREPMYPEIEAFLADPEGGIRQPYGAIIAPGHRDGPESRAEITGHFAVAPARLFHSLEPSSPGYSVPDRIQKLFVEVESGIHPDLSDALQELEEADEDAEENGWPLPSSSAYRNARTLLPRLYRLSPRRFSAYPLFDGEIVLDATTKSKHAVVVVCKADGSVLCFVNIHRRERRAKYAGVSDLPDGFLREAFHDLENADE